MRWRDESGFALVTVLVAFVALIGLTVAITGYALGSQNTSRRDQNWNAALAAAQAGADEYLFRLNNSSNYWQYDAANPPPGGDPAFSGWVDVPGAASGVPKFRYDVNRALNEQTFFQSGAVTIKASGKVGRSVRTIETVFRLRSFVDFLYFTDLETSDPKIVSGQPSKCGKATSGPQRYRYAYNAGGTNVPSYDSSPGSGSCNQIRFVSGDVINGPIHSNDRIYICGTPVFRGDASTTAPGSVVANPPSGNLWTGDSGCSNSPSFQGRFNKLFWEQKLTPPDSNTSLACYADATRSGCAGVPDALRTGCLYTGPTLINFRSNGNMDVYSPYTRRSSAGCRNGSDVPLPDNGVIYVQSIPSSSSDPNYTNWAKSGGGCNAPTASNSAPLTAPIVAQPFLETNKPLGLPRSNESLSFGFSYPCNSGDVFVQGTLKGQVTIGAANNIIVTGNVLYADKPAGATAYQGSNLLGLIANAFVQVYHPICSSSCGGSSNNNKEYTSAGSHTVFGQSWPPRSLVDPEINAAIFAVNNSFAVQNYNVGDTDRVGTGGNPGKLTVFGTIAQENRGAVGTGSGSNPITGYLKNYNYDSRLRYLAPPFFLNPTSQPTFTARTFKELQAAHAP
jgi:hypothetical protein